MVHEDTLSSVLSDFARTMATDFPIQAILDHLVERIVTILPITAAGVTLIAKGRAPQYVAASDGAALKFEKLQTELGQGPCMTAFQSAQAVAIPDLAAELRYPDFGPAALAAGMAAVFTFPLRHGDGQLGALDLYRDVVGGLAPEDMAAAQTLADVTTAYLLNAEAREQARETSDRFKDSALRDALTGLPNRVLLHQRIEHAALRAQRSGGTAAVLFADLDRFKRVNDTYGHAVGDDLLIAVAQRLSALVRPGDTLARVSGDEFVFLCEDLAHDDDVEPLAARIREAFADAFVIAGVRVSITASIGIAYAGPGQAVSNQLVIDADMAMYQAKRNGGDAHQIIDLRAAELDQQHHQLEQDLRAALAGPDIDLAYQPIVETANGRVVGVEALLRWTHPDRGQVPALTAVSVAERTELITALGTWVLERGCRDQVTWAAQFPRSPLQLSINVSARQLMGPHFTRTVESVLAGTGMDPAVLTLEITEGIFISDGERATNVLADLQALGVRLALDDFGTGYSSLSYLRRFPVDVLKIDQSFVADIGRDPAGAAIVAAVTNLAHVLGLSVTAEGVETELQRAEVAKIGCELSQGFLYAGPMPAALITALLGGTDRALHLPVVS